MLRFAALQTRLAAAMLAAVLLAALAALAAGPALAGAAELTVNTTADQAPSPAECSGAAGDCSLRQAVDKANGNPGPDTIALPAGHYALTAKGPEENLNENGDLDVGGQSEININGAGARSSVIDAAGLEQRVLDVLPQGSLSLSQLTVTGGLAINVDGGGVQAVNASLKLDQVAVLGNVSSKQGSGGGIALEHSKATITSSLIAANRNSGDGGGLWIGEGETSLINTTIANNIVETALNPETPNLGAFGGGMEVNGGRLSMQNVTITGNSISDNNGGEPRGSGAAISDGPDTGTIVNTIVYGNTETNVDLLGQCEGHLPSEGHNLEQQPPAGEPRCFETPTDLVADPMLGPLASNSGETDTIAIPRTSPALNAGDLARCPATDQRGFPRPQLGGCDIGAFEFVPPPPTIRRGAKVRVKRAGKTFLVKTGFRVSCSAEGETCTGTIQARAKKRSIGKRAFTVAPGHTQKLVLKLNGKGAKLLRQRKKLRANFEVNVRGGSSGVPASLTPLLKLKLPLKHHRAHH